MSPPVLTLDWADGQPTFESLGDAGKFFLWPLVGKTGYREVGIFGGASSSFENDHTGEYPLYLVGLRAGRMWNRHLEVAFELVPALMLRQSDGKWNYAGGFYWGPRCYLLPVDPKRTWVPNPYLELLGGVLESARKMPEQGSVFSFSYEPGIGAKTFVIENLSWDVGLRFMHISNAYLAEENPVRDGLLYWTGFSWVW